MEFQFQLFLDAYIESLYFFQDINEYVAVPQEENGIRDLKKGFYDRSNFPKL